LQERVVVVALLEERIVVVALLEEQAVVLALLEEQVGLAQQQQVAALGVERQALEVLAPEEQTEGGLVTTSQVAEQAVRLVCTHTPLEPLEL
jgi:hypothetical protein